MGMRTLIAVLVAAPWVLWAAVRTAGFPLGYPLVAVLAFTPYVALSSFVPVVVALALRVRGVALVAAAAAVALAVAVVPRGVAGPRPEAGGPRLVVMTFNAWVGQADAAAVLRVAREHDVDVLSLQEALPGFLGRVDADGRYPGRAGGPGTALRSRFPLRDVRLAPNELGRAQPEARLRVPGAPPVWIKAVHPWPPVDGASAPGWRRSLLRLPAPDVRGDVAIMAGDFNATLDHAELRGLLGRGWVDAADAAGAGLAWTWPAARRRALPITIDHVLVDRRVRVERVHVVGIPRSDHRAVIAELRLPAAAPAGLSRPGRGSIRQR